MKFNRQYRILIQKDDESEALEITSPLTLQFDIIRNTGASLNSGQFRIYNLSEKNRSQIFQERFVLRKRAGVGDFKKVVLQAGYDTLATIFVGNILEAYSERSGPDIITFISAQDGAFGTYNSFSNFSVNKGESNSNIIGSLISDLSGVSKGSIGDIIGSTDRGLSFNGNTFTLLREKSGEKAFIDLEKVNVLGSNEAIEGQVPLVSSSTGLLAVPKRRGSFVTTDLIFEPQIVVGQIVELQSSINPIFDGQYKVLGLRHSGTISGAIGGDCRTNLDLYLGSQALGGLKIIK